jgi:hypothetical protein
MSEQTAPPADHRRLRPVTISLRPHQSSLLISDVFLSFFGTRNGAAVYPEARLAARSGQRRFACRRVPLEGPLWGID